MSDKLVAPERIWLLDYGDVSCTWCEDADPDGEHRDSIEYVRADALSPKEAELVKPPREYEVSGDAVGGGEAKVYHLGAALQGIADQHAAVLTPRQIKALYDAANGVWIDARTPTASHDAARERIALRELREAGQGVLAAMDAHNEKNGTFLGGPAFFELGRKIAKADAILAALPTTDGALQQAIHETQVAPISDPHAGAKNGKELLRLKQLARLATPPTTDASARMRDADPELQEIADGAYGDNPMVRGLARAALAPSNNEVSGDK